MAVGQLDGIGQITGDVTIKTVTIEFNPSHVTIQRIQEVLEGIGYSSNVTE